MQINIRKEDLEQMLNTKSKKQIAEALGVNGKTLNEYLEKLGIKK